MEYEYPSQAIGNHCKGIVKLTIPSEGGLQGTNVVPIGDVCCLIVKAATQSKNANIKEKAEAYELWIFDEVLPAVHNTGTYSTKPDDIPALTADTGYIKEIRRAMEKQGNTPQEVAKMIEMVCKRFGLPLPLNFVKKSPFEQLSFTVNLAKS